MALKVALVTAVLQLALLSSTQAVPWTTWNIILAHNATSVVPARMPPLTGDWGVKTSSLYENDGNGKPGALIGREQGTGAFISDNGMFVLYTCLIFTEEDQIHFTTTGQWGVKNVTIGVITGGTGIYKGISGQITCPYICANGDEYFYQCPDWYGLCQLSYKKTMGVEPKPTPKPQGKRRMAAL